MKREKERDSLTVSTHSVSVFDEIREKLRDRDTDRDSKLVWGASTHIDKHPGEETSETETGKQFKDLTESVTELHR